MVIRRKVATCEGMNDFFGKKITYIEATCNWLKC